MEPSRREVLCGLCTAAVACNQQTSNPPGDTEIDTGRRPTVPVPQPFTPCINPGTAAEGWTRIGFDEYPELEQLLGHAYLSRGGRQLVVAHVEQDCFVALRRPCSHEGVLIEYRDERNGFVCPRHGAIYGWDGAVLSGPPPSDIPAYPAGLRDGAVWVLIEDPTP